MLHFIMKKLFPFVIACSFMAAKAAECETGWIPFKDELCIKAFTSLLSYDEARGFCSSQGNEIAKASLVMVKEEDLQSLLADYTNNTYDNVWLGGKFNREAAQFIWDDGTRLTYTNWQEGYPRTSTDQDTCIELRPMDAQLLINSKGKWADVVCQKRNLVICQRTSTWTLQDAVLEIQRIRKQYQEDLAAVNNELNDVGNKLNDARAERNVLREELRTTRSMVVPVGSIYIEYSGQPSPPTLWPNFTWQDITSTYAGLFFRAYGGGSAAWGSTQAECAPRITQMDHQGRRLNGYPNPTEIPTNGWSAYGSLGNSASNPYYSEGLRLHTQGCEVRPKNQAIRIWKRNA